MKVSEEKLSGSGNAMELVQIENTEIVNKKFEYSFMLLTIPMCLLILILNISVLKKLWKVEKTTINEMMKLDCIVNILYAFLCTFQQSPFFRVLEMDIFCFPHVVLSFAFAVCNRLLPVAIVSYR